MELEVATTQDIIDEFRKRELHFLLVTIETTNSRREADISIAGQGKNRRSLLRLCQMAKVAFSRNPNPDDESRSDN